MTSESTPPRVTLASKLMLGVAGVGFIQFINALAAAVRLSAHHDTLLEMAKDPLGMAHLIAGIEEMLRIEIGLGMICVLGLGVLVLAQRRSRLTRLLAWPCYGIVLVVNLWIMGFDSTTVDIGNLVGMEQAVHPTQDYVDKLNDMLTPVWYIPIHYLTQLACIVGAAAIIISLAGQASFEYFRGRLPVSDSHYLDTENLKRS